MKRSYYCDTIENFNLTRSEEIIGKMATASRFADVLNQKNAWLEEINILQNGLTKFDGSIYFEYSIPRMGQRIDVVLIIGPVIFVLEFKIGEKDFPIYAIDQVWDYALDLKNFHETSHDKYIAPILISTKAIVTNTLVDLTFQKDKLLLPVKTNVELLWKVIKEVLCFTDGSNINISIWEKGRYHPTPTIIEAAMALYNGHSVNDISRSDAGATNLSQTSEAISKIIEYSRKKSIKSICFVTGVPGAGKTLIGLNIATRNIDKENELYSVFLSAMVP